ncbi:MAG TPA: DUF983 domain-containing protein [Rhizomicrobium sp.]
MLRPLRVASSCAPCWLDCATFDLGGGASVGVILVVGFLVVRAALIVEVAYAPPYWVHAARWLPAIGILTLGGLRLAKSTLVVLQYSQKVREGRLAE